MTIKNSLYNLSLLYIMNCTCEGQKKEFHKKLYEYGVEVNICRIASSSSIKKVAFVCQCCHKKKEDKIGVLLERKGICDDCGYKKDIHTMDIDKVIDFHSVLNQESTTLCYECVKPLPKMKEDLYRIWKGNKVCDMCWANHEDERNELWDHVQQWKGICDSCELCGIQRQHPGVRFQYASSNVFEKNDTICNMVMKGVSKECIETQLSMCKYICLPCHGFIGDIEKELPFMDIQKKLKDKRDHGIISNETYEKEMHVWSISYKEKMEKIYETLKEEIHKKQLRDSQDNCPYCYEPILESDKVHPNIVLTEDRLDSLIHETSLCINPEQNHFGVYQCEKCKKKVHYSCFEKHKVFQMRNTYEYKEDMETYQSEDEDLEDGLACPNCRHENGWYRNGVGIVSRRKNRTENPVHIEFQLREKYNMTGKSYLKQLNREQKSLFYTLLYEQNQTLL